MRDGLLSGKRFEKSSYILTKGTLRLFTFNDGGKTDLMKESPRDFLRVLTYGVKRKDYKEFKLPMEYMK